MSPRLFVPAAEVIAGVTELIIVGAAHRHLVRVLRLREGDAFVIFNGVGEEISAKLERVGPDEARARLGARQTLAAAPAHITLLQAVAKGERMDWVVQKTTELGIAAIVPILTRHVVVRLDQQAAEAKQRRWQLIAQEAARQCGRADVPLVERPVTLSEALHGLAPGCRYALWESAQGQPLHTSVGAEMRTVQLLIGPEGGLAEEEIETAKSFDFVPVTLGPRILRTETAAIVAVTLVQAATGGLTSPPHTQQRLRNCSYTNT